MKTLLFLLLSITATAQIGTTPKVIYRANKADTVTCAFSPSGAATLTVLADNEVIDDKVVLVGYRVHQFTLDSGSTIVAYGTGIIGYTVYRNGINVTQVAQQETTLQEIQAIVDGLTTAKLKRLIAFMVYEDRKALRKLKQAIK